MPAVVIFVRSETLCNRDLRDERRYRRAAALRARARHKLSQRELAKRSGVTNSTISLIESNQMNPSVGALKRILDGMPMGLAEFFAIEPDRPRKAFYRSDELTEIGKTADLLSPGRRQSCSAGACRS